MRILVTGGAGYVGSHAARVLSRFGGHRVRIYDNLSTGHRALADEFELVVGDIRDSKMLSAAMEDVQAVMHFAAHCYVGESVQNPRKYFDNNVRAALNLLDVALDRGVRKFIFSSTCAVYGVPASVPIAEDTVRQPINPYGVCKLLFEQALEAYDKAYQLRFVSLRYFNAAGADESGEIGERHDPETHLIPLALEVAAGTRPELEIYGTDYPTADGTCVRDYIHVNDLGAGHLKALEHLGAGGSSACLNLGTGQGHSVKEVVAVVEEITGAKVRKKYCPRRPGDPPELVADPTRAQQALKWRATRSLRDIVSSAWNWMQKRAAAK